MTKRQAIADFETEAIGPRPSYPPRPVGLALVDGRQKTYFAFDHKNGKNTHSMRQARQALATLWQDDDVELVFHNSKFDVDVAMTHWGFEPLPWQRCHDTLFQLYLDDPRAASLSLKPSSERILGLPPQEQDAVHDWLVANGIVKNRQKDWGAYICEAPPEVVGPYAIGDCTRTQKLFKHLAPSLKRRGMQAAYDRERRLMPILLESETKGVRVAHERLLGDVKKYRAAQGILDQWLRRRLKASAGMNLDSAEELADHLDRANLVTDWVITPGGARSTAAKNLRINDQRVKDALTYRSKLLNSLETFMEPWLRNAERSGGWTYTNWNQVRGEHDKGTRTGRMSSNPNWQNLPNPFEREEALSLPIKLPPLPQPKLYILADSDDDVLISLDYSQQELRALGHFEDGPLLAAYQANPRMDIHDLATALINKLLNANYKRKPIKTIGFGLIYGMGADLLAAQAGVDVETARVLKRAYLSIFPGMRALQQQLTQRARLGLPIHTWGGREYYVEPPRVVNGMPRTFEYKLLNLLIQGSCADATKEALCRFYETRRQGEGRFVAQVHDQLIISAPRKNLKAAHERLRDAMESLQFDVPMLTDPSVGESWGTLEPLK